MAGEKPRGAPEEGPFTIVAALTGVAAIVVAAQTILVPAARMVAGGMLIGAAIGVPATWFAIHRGRTRRPRAPGPLMIVSLAIAAFGLFLLLAPVIVRPAQPSQGAEQPASAPPRPAPPPPWYPPGSRPPEQAPTGAPPPGGSR